MASCESTQSTIFHATQVNRKFKNECASVEYEQYFSDWKRPWNFIILSVNFVGADKTFELKNHSTFDIHRTDLMQTQNKIF